MATNKNFIVKNGLEVGGVEVISASGEITNAAFPSGLTPAFSNLTLSGNLNFADNGKAIFGAGSDLQIYHDGGHSYISDIGSGNLKIKSGAGFDLQTTTGENYLDAVENGAINLYYDNSKKLATTATGIDVTGTATMDGLTVDGRTDLRGGATPLGVYRTLALAVDTQSEIVLGSQDLSNNYVDAVKIRGLLKANKTDGELSFYTLSSSTLSERFRIAADGSLSTPTLGTSNVRFGVNAGNSIIAGGNFNVVVGDNAGTAITTGDQNVLLGYGAGDAITTGVSNTAVGTLSLSANTTASNNTAVGNNSLTANTTGDRNVAIGAQALDANTVGTKNVAVGVDSLGTNTKGRRNVAIGDSALLSQEPASAIDTYNTAVGHGAGSSVTTGTYNTLIGGLAGDAITTGIRNTTVGHQSLSANTTGSLNTALGRSALFSNTTASNNTAVGYEALYANTTGVSNVAVGYQAANTNSTGIESVVIGARAGYTNSTGQRNVIIGRDAGYYATGSNSTFVGFGAGVAVTTGSNNTIIGSYNGNQNGVNITTSSDCIVLSGGDGFPRAYWDGVSTWIFGCGATNAITEDRVSIDRTAMYTFPDGGTQLGYPAYRWGQIFSVTGFISTSDARDKTSVTALTTDEIQASKLLAREIGTYQWLSSIEEKGADKARHHVGMTVQRAIEIMESCNLDPMRYGFICYDAWEKDDLPQLEAGDRYGFRYDELNQFIAAGFNARLEALESN